MFKHANVYVPGAKAKITPDEGSKVASQGGVGTIVDVDPDAKTAQVKNVLGDVVTVDLDRIELVEE